MVQEEEQDAGLRVASAHEGVEQETRLQRQVRHLVSISNHCDDLNKQSKSHFSYREIGKEQKLTPKDSWSRATCTCLKRFLVLH